MNSVFINWKTTAAGLAALFSGLGIIIHALSTNVIDMNQISVGFGLVSAGITGIFAHDGKAPVAPPAVSTIGVSND